MKPLQIVDLNRFFVELPLREVPERNLARELPHWPVFEVWCVTLQGGAVGFGENQVFYTRGPNSSGTQRRIAGRNAIELMWDDSVGIGLQMALFDAVGKALGVPLHVLLGQKVRDRVPLAWWAIDMPPDDWVRECHTALKLGYRDFKTKARPWHDLNAQLDAVTAAVPEGFKIGLDFNGLLQDADRATAILKDLKGRFAKVAIYENPIPQGDREGGKALQSAVGLTIAHHYGNPSAEVQLREDLGDGFVLGDGTTSEGASQVLQNAHVCAAFDKPFWLQQVGSGITAAYSLHFAAVLSHATWPSVNCHQLYANDLLATPIQVTQGTAPVPDRPGLGLEFDKDALNRYRFEKPYTERPNPPRLIEVSWPNDAKTFYANGTQLRDDARAGRMPFFLRGVKTRLVPDDGSSDWQDLHQRARKAPVYQGDPRAM